MFYDGVIRLLPDNRVVSVKDQKYKENLVIGKMWFRSLAEKCVYLDIITVLRLELCKTNVE